MFEVAMTRRGEADKNFEITVLVLQKRSKVIDDTATDGKLPAYKVTDLDIRPKKNFSSDSELKSLI